MNAWVNQLASCGNCGGYMQHVGKSEDERPEQMAAVLRDGFAVVVCRGYKCPENGNRYKLPVSLFALEAYVDGR